LKPLVRTVHGWLTISAQDLLFLFRSDLYCLSRVLPYQGAPVDPDRIFGVIAQVRPIAPECVPVHGDRHRPGLRSPEAHMQYPVVRCVLTRPLRRAAATGHRVAMRRAESAAFVRESRVSTLLIRTNCDIRDLPLPTTCRSATILQGALGPAQFLQVEGWPSG